MKEGRTIKPVKQRTQDGQDDKYAAEALSAQSSV